MVVKKMQGAGIVGKQHSRQDRRERSGQRHLPLREPPRSAWSLSERDAEKRLDTDDRKCNNTFGLVSLPKKGLVSRRGYHLMEYTRTREISRNAQGKQPGIYPLSAQLLLGIDRNALERNNETGLLHAGNLNFRTLPASVLRHLPMVKEDYPELFE